MELTKELNRILKIKTKLSMFFHPQMDRQTEQMNQKLEQYLQFFVNHRQKNWLEWLAMAKFAVNNKKKRKSRESNRVCRKNKESIRESKSSIKKSLGENEVVSK